MVQGKILFLQLEELKDMLLLDSGLLAHVFCNEKMVDKTWNSNEHLALATNGGLFQTSVKGRVLNCNEVWISKDSMTNIFSLGLLTDKFA